MKVEGKSASKKTSLFDDCRKLDFRAENEEEGKVLSWLFKAFESGVLYHLSRTVLARINRDVEIFSKGTIPPNPIDLSYWTVESQPQFDSEKFLSDTTKWVENNNPFDTIKGK